MDFDFQGIILYLTTRLSKRLKIKPQVFKQFLMDLLCCMFGLRDAYLVDGISMDLPAVYEVCQEVYAYVLSGQMAGASAAAVKVMWGDEFRAWVSLCITASNSGSDCNDCYVDDGKWSGSYLSVSKVLIIQLNQFDIIICNLNLFCGKYHSLGVSGLQNVVVDVTNISGMDSQYCGRVCDTSERAVVAEKLMLLFQPLCKAIEISIDSRENHVILYVISAATGDNGADHSNSDSGRDGVESADISTISGDECLSVVFSIIASVGAKAKFDVAVPATELPDGLSFALLAGWLLNYACIYHCPSGGNSDDADGLVRCLCNQPMMKHTLSYAHLKPVKMETPVSLMEFTVPVGLLDCAFDDSQTVENHIRWCVKQHVMKINRFVGVSNDNHVDQRLTPFGPNTVTHAICSVCEPCIIL